APTPQRTPRTQRITPFEIISPGVLCVLRSGSEPLMALLAAVVFDFDGIILDSETAEFESHRRIYQRHGAALTPEEWCDQIGIWSEAHDRRWCDRLNDLSGAAME